MSFLEVISPKKCHILPKSPVSLKDLKEFISTYNGLDADDFYFTHNGKLVNNYEYIADGVIYATPRLVGGKGGFGSMLRAIGAQIEKTTNREACRDLSGRRLRDINEEKRLKNWIALQADREREAAEKRRKKLERMVAEPKHEFEDKEYDKQRSELMENAWDAVDQGMKASTSGCSSSTSNSRKRKLPEPSVKKKKTCLWVDDIEDESISSSIDSDDSEEEAKAPKNILKKEAEEVVKVKTNKSIGSEDDVKECTEENGHRSSGSDDSSEANDKQLKDAPPDGIKQVATG